MQHYSDTHHLAYPASEYHTKVEKEWRELPFNKVQLCRAIHEGVHAADYIPEKPDRDTMLTELWAQTGRAPLRAMVEVMYQTQLGEQYKKPETAA